VRYSIFGYYGQGNTGDEAILKSLIDGISRRSSESIISVYSNNPRSTKEQFGIDSYRFFPLRLLKTFRCLVSRARYDFFSAYLNFFKTDIVIIGGGGLFFDTPETNRWMKGYLKLIDYAKFFNKKVAVIGVSVGPINHESSYRFLYESFEKLDLISVRDQNSKDILVKCGMSESRIHLVPDLVFTMESASSDRIADILSTEDLASEKNIIAMTPCVYNAKLEGWSEQYALLCAYLTESFNVDIWLIPMQKSKDNSDLGALLLFYNKLPENIKLHVKVVYGDYQPDDIQALIGLADFVFAERLHGTIMAFNTCRAFMSLAYMPKVSNLLNDIGMQASSVSMQDFLSGSCFERLAAAIKNSFELEYAIEAPHNVRVSAQKNFSLLHDLL
jgi:polysaccharide pyruvyl transferase CsaB